MYTSYKDVTVTGSYTETVTLSAASGDEIVAQINYTVNKAAGNDTGFYINQTDTASPGTSYLIHAQQNTSNRFYVRNDGTVWCATSMSVNTGRYTTGATTVPLDFRPWGGGSRTGSGSNSALHLGSAFFDGSSNNCTANQQYWCDIQSTYNQTSGTAANTDLRVNRVETSIGSGNQLLMDLQRDGTTQYNVDRVGTITSKAGRIVNASRYTTTQTLDATDHQVACDTDGGAWTVSLPAGVAGTEYRIANTGTSANNLTIAPNGAELLLGVNSNFVLGDGEALQIVYESTEGWF